MNNEDTVAVFAENGQAKKTALSEFPIQGRGGKGVVVYKANPGTGAIIGAAMVNNEDNILLIGKNSICISAQEVPLLGRAATGNIMIKNGKISSVVKL